MITIQLTEDEAEEFAGWLHDRFDDEFDKLNESMINEYYDETEKSIKLATLLSRVFMQIGIPVLSNLDLFKAYNLSKVIEELEAAKSKHE